MKNQEQSGKTLRISVTGNPNVGKSTLFNALVTGNARVSNFPGITAESLVGKDRWGDIDVEVTDLPGCYGLQLDLPESRHCQQHLGAPQKSDLIVSVIDAVSLRRNMNLLAECMQKGTPNAVIVTRTDEARLRGVEIDFQRLEEMLQVPVLELAHRHAHRNAGLKEFILAAAERPVSPQDTVLDSKWVDDTVAAVTRPVRPEEARKRREKEESTTEL